MPTGIGSNSRRGWVYDDVHRGWHIPLEGVMDSRKSVDTEAVVTEAAEAADRVSMQDPEHLKRWLAASGRTWLVFNALDLVDSLPWPDGVDLFKEIVACYKNHRATIPTGRVELQEDPTTGNMVEVQIMKGESLELEELDRAIRALVRLATERDAAWKLENPAL